MTTHPHDNCRIAIFTTNIDAYSQTFVRRHVLNLLGGKTVVISTSHPEPGPGHSNNGVPNLTLRRIHRTETQGKLSDITQRVSHHIQWKHQGYKIRQFLRHNEVTHILFEFGYVAANVSQHVNSLGLPTYCYFRGSDASSFLSNGAYLQRLRIILPRPDGVISVSRHLLKNLENNSITIPRSVIIPSGTDTQVFKPAPIKEKSVLFVGRFVAKKSPEKVIRAFAMTSRQHEYNLVLIGDGPELESCRLLARELGVIERVKFRGKQGHDFVRNAMSTAEVYMQHFETAPNGDTEGMPSAIQEAMASGCAVITTRHAGIPDHITHEINGLLVDPGNVVGMATLLNNVTQNEEMRRELGSAARHYATSKLDYRELYMHLENFMFDPSISAQNSR